MLSVAMLSTGDEVLHGQIVDTNAAWLADYLFIQGIPLCERATVGDELHALVNMLKQLSERMDVVIVNGGLGPTVDDLSAQAAAVALGEELLEFPQWIRQMEQKFARSGRVMAENNRKQALLPPSAEIIDNPVGTACGFTIKLGNCLFFFTPGVPTEFKIMVEEQILPRLKQNSPLGEALICKRLTTFGRSESLLAEELESVVLPPGIVLGFRSAMPIIEVKLTGKPAQQQLLAELWQQIKAIIGHNIILEGVEGVAVPIQRQLQQQQLSLAVSEQFTAGGLYWQLAQADTLLVGGVLMAATDRHQLAETMQQAQSVRQHSQADIALAVGELADREVTVALATAQRCYGMRVEYQFTSASRDQYRQITVMLALDLLRRWLYDLPLNGTYDWIRLCEYR